MAAQGTTIESRYDTSTGKLVIVSDYRQVELVASTDPRLSDARAPTGPAGGHMEGTYPDPSVRGMTVKQHIGVSPAGSWDIGTSGAGLRNVYAFRFVTPIVPIALF